MRTYEEQLNESFDGLLREADAYFMESSKVHKTLAEVARRLDEASIPYALLGALALARHGYQRMTVDIDLLLTPEGLAEFRERYVGDEFVPTFPGAAKSFRAADTGVRVDVITSGEYPGDGKPKAVMYPNPLDVSVEMAGIRVVTLEKLIEFKLASGMTAKHRMRDLSDVQDTIRGLALSQNFAHGLDPSVQATYSEIWRTAQIPDPAAHERL